MRPEQLLRKLDKVKSEPVIVWRDLDELIPYARNARTHTPAQVAQIAGSMREFGWTNPVLIDGENGIIAGHGRVLAAQKLGLPRAPCIELGHLTKAQARAYAIADNKLALNAGWDDNLLAGEIDDLVKGDFDVSLLGFADRELSKLLEGLGGGGDASTADVIASSWAVIVECDNEAEQVALIERLQGEGFKVKGSVA